VQVCRDELCFPVTDFRPMFGIAPAEMGLETRQIHCWKISLDESKKMKRVNKKLVVRSIFSCEQWTNSSGYISSGLQGMASSQFASHKYRRRVSTRCKFGQLSSISYLLSRYKVSQETMLFSHYNPKPPLFPPHARINPRKFYRTWRYNKDFLWAVSLC
jgi:hypothetical protein